MALVEHWIKSALLGSEELQAVIGDSVHFVRPPQGTEFPYLTIRRSATEYAQHMGGAFRNKTGRFEIRAWSNSYDYSAETVAPLIRNALKDKRGQLAGVNVQRSHIAGEFDDEEPPWWADDEHALARVLVLDVVYEE